MVLSPDIRSTARRLALEGRSRLSFCGLARVLRTYRHQQIKSWQASAPHATMVSEADLPRTLPSPPGQMRQLQNLHLADSLQNVFLLLAADARVV